MSVDPSRTVTEAIGKIREQMKVNLTYFDHAPNDRETLRILQGHIEDQLKEIERISAAA